MVGKELLARGFQAYACQELDGATVIEERRSGADWSTLEGRVIVLGLRRREFRMRHRLFSGAELRALLRAAGFARVALYGSLDGAPYDRGARCLVAVARP
jgi:hypothetical protein